MKTLARRLLVCFIVLTAGTSTAFSALFTECGWGNRSNEDGTQERLPYTYGCVIVESMSHSGDWAVAYHSVYIDTLYSENDVSFNYDGTCQLRHDAGVLEDRTTGSGRLRRPGIFEDRWFRTRVSTRGLRPQNYPFAAYTTLKAHRTERPSHRADWRAGGTLWIMVN